MGKFQYAMSVAFMMGLQSGVLFCLGLYCNVL